jgi:hypothetical protein
MIVATSLLSVLVVVSTATILLLPVPEVAPMTAAVLLTTPAMIAIPHHLLILVVTTAAITAGPLSPLLAKTNHQTTVLTPPVTPLMTHTRTLHGDGNSPAATAALTVMARRTMMTTVPIVAPTPMTNVPPVMILTSSNNCRSTKT